ncbi:EamA family transporter [Paenibacillus apii]|uniref:EamA family transporter n=1 Tax=Paenibacillus apii TaxID=1850370 RepID=UPI002E2E216E|nr:EamA family transporter [Paenibacillus apii]
MENSPNLRDEQKRLEYRFFSRSISRVILLGEPVLAIILAYLFLGETISIFQFIGGLMTLLGMAGYFWTPSLTQTVSKDRSYS